MTMMLHYVIFIIYNFLIGSENRTDAANIWTNEINNSSTAVKGPSVAVFRNNRPNGGSQKGQEENISGWSDLANDHLNSMTGDVSVRCSTPRPKVIKVQEYHRDAGKRYLPSCVTLHRCDHSTGCCDEEDHVCAPVRKRRVPMYFFVLKLEATLENVEETDSVQTDLQVERLYFSNHTQCGCRKRKIRSTPAPPIDRALSASQTNIQSFYFLWVMAILSLRAKRFLIS
ncbi:hypothetical protein CHUAL_001033 [Chamberlinius hualienensis]